MPQLIALPDATQESLLTALAAASFGPVAAARPANENATHVRLQDGSVLVVCRYGDTSALVYPPAEYAKVDLGKVRDPRVAQMWDVNAPWS